MLDVSSTRKKFQKKKLYGFKSLQVNSPAHLRIAEANGCLGGRKLSIYIYVSVC